MEDIDAAFTHGLTRDGSSTELEDPRRRDRRRRGHPSLEDDFDEREGRDRGRNPNEAKDSRITLSGLLNALDGVSAQEGRLLFATTNRYHSLDPALIRPGRMDMHVEFRLASQYQARELYKRFYFPDAPMAQHTQSVHPSCQRKKSMGSRNNLLHRYPNASYRWLACKDT